MAFRDPRIIKKKKEGYKRGLTLQIRTNDGRILTVPADINFRASDDGKLSDLLEGILRPKPKSQTYVQFKKIFRKLQFKFPKIPRTIQSRISKVAVYVPQVPQSQNRSVDRGNMGNIKGNPYNSA